MLRGNLDKISEHGKRADGIVKNMLEHSRGVSGERRVVDLNALIEEALNLAYHGARAQDASFNITLEREFDDGLPPIELAPQEMTRVFLNLFGNGFHATTKRRRVAGFSADVKSGDARSRRGGRSAGARQRHWHRTGDQGQIVPAFRYNQAHRRRHRARPVDQL
jgi:nitrogen-specific signal transduction histidine kinase